MTITKDIVRLFRKIREEKVTLFIGSGFSLSAGAPSAKQIEDAIKADCESVKGGDLQSISEDYVQRHNESRAELIKLLKSLFPDSALDDSCQKQLSQIPHFKKIFTTNYDSYIEDVYGANKCRVLRNDVDMATLEHRSVDIYKLHGDFGCPDNIVITRDDYDNFLQRKKNPLMWAQLQSAMVDTHILFVGYSVDDQNIFDLIKEVESACSGSQKEMFMITPSVENYKLNRLRKHKITWIEAKAADFFTQLEENIIDSIFKDYRHKLVSSGTFIQFCHYHDLNPSVEENEDNNCVTRILGYKGHQLNKEIKFTVKGSENPLSRIAPITEDGPLKGQYGIVIPSSELLKFDYRINNLLINSLEETKNLYILPLKEKKVVSIKIPSRKFIEHVECVGQRTGENTYTYFLNLEIYKLTLEITPSKQNDLYIHVNIHTEMADEYKSHSAALKWIELLDAMNNGEEVIFPNILGISIRLQEEQEPNLFKKYKDYYMMVQEIELLSNVTFTKYYNWSEEREKNAIRLLRWLTNKEIIHVEPPSGFSFNIEFDNVEEVAVMRNADPAKKWGLLFSKDCPPITFNEHEYIIPHEYIYFEKCRILGNEVLPDKRIRIYFRDENTNYKELLSSKPIIPETAAIQLTDLDFE